MLVAAFRARDWLFRWTTQPYTTHQALSRARMSHGAGFSSSNEMRFRSGGAFSFPRMISAPVNGNAIRLKISSGFVTAPKRRRRKRDGAQARNAPRKTDQLRRSRSRRFGGVRERGLGALKEPANCERLGRCDEAARAELHRRLAGLRGAK
jgi:hypothetical protein